MLFPQNIFLLKLPTNYYTKPYISSKKYTTSMCAQITSVKENIIAAPCTVGTHTKFTSVILFLLWHLRQAVVWIIYAPNSF